MDHPISAPARPYLGHLAALMTVTVWGATFISTKVLLRSFAPVEILFDRFLLGFFLLVLMHPRPLRGAGLRRELTFAAAGLCGVCLYYLLENIALQYTMTANVSIIVSSAPLFTALVSRLIFREGERLRGGFLLGFLVAMGGIVLMAVQDSPMAVSPAGDLLALLAAVVWAFYSSLTKKIAAYGYPTILTTRRVFFYGIWFMVPVLVFSQPAWDPGRFLAAENLGNLLFLGLGASALCFVSWNWAVGQLGSVKASAYIYLSPVVTLAASAVLLREPVTPAACLGTVLILGGLGLSEGRRKRE